MGIPVLSSASTSVVACLSATVLFIPLSCIHPHVVILSVNPIAWAPAHGGQESEPASHADEPLGSAEVELVRKTKAESSPPGEANTNHVSGGLPVKLENAQNGDASTT
jgi:hypothetical protein